MKSSIALALSGFVLFSVAGSQTTVAATHSKTTRHSTTSKKTSSTKKVTATKLVDDALRANAYLVKSARADAGLDAQKARNKPFWKAVQSTTKNLNRAKSGLAAKNKEFFMGVRDARSSVEQMKVDWKLTGSKNKSVVEAGRKVSYAVALLRMNYSQEAARKKKGGSLTAKESAHFEKIRTQQRQFLAKAKTLRKKAGKDKGFLAGLTKMEKLANKMLKGKKSVGAYIGALYLYDDMRGLAWGYDYYVDPAWRSDWAEMESISTSESTYEEITSSETYEWSDTETAVAASESVDVSENEISDADATSETQFAEETKTDLNDTEMQEVATEENEIADTSSDEDSNEDMSMDDPAETKLEAVAESSNDEDDSDTRTSARSRRSSSRDEDEDDGSSRRRSSSRDSDDDGGGRGGRDADVDNSSDDSGSYQNQSDDSGGGNDDSGGGYDNGGGNDDSGGGDDGGGGGDDDGGGD